MDHHINFHDFLSYRPDFIVISICWDTDAPQGGYDNFSRKSFKWVVFAASWELLRCSHKKWIKNYTETVYLEVSHVECEL